MGTSTDSRRDATACPFLCGGAFLAIIVPQKYYLGVAGGILLLYFGLLQGFNGYVHSADNLIAVIDVKLLGAGHLIKETADGGSFAFEPEGLLSTIPCWAHVLLGAYVGGLITHTDENKERVRKIALFGIILLLPVSCCNTSILSTRSCGLVPIH